MTLTWNEPSELNGLPILGYRLLVRSDVSSDSVDVQEEFSLLIVDSDDISSREYLVTGLKGGYNYNCSLVAFNQIGIDAKTTVELTGRTLDPTLPTPPRNFEVSVS